MASKCWFVQGQSHYPPPKIPANGIGFPQGPLCPGHIIPNLKSLGSVINRKGPLEITPDMKISSTTARNFSRTLKESNNFNTSVSADLGNSLPKAVGLFITLSVGVAFNDSVKNHWEFDSLDTLVFDPTTEYIEDSVEDPDIINYLDKMGALKSSKLFMITGMKIGKGGKNSLSNMKKAAIKTNVSSGLSSAAEAGPSSNVIWEKSDSSHADKMDDFVWAVRLAKLKKGRFCSVWHHELFDKGATFGVEDKVEQGHRIAQALKDEGIEVPEGFSASFEDDIFILGA